MAALRERWDVAGAAVIGALAFCYQIPVSVVVPTHIRWMMKADRAAALSGWLFERNEPWTMPFGILHTMMPPLTMTVGYSDALPWLAVPAKLLDAPAGQPWQYHGLFLFACYVLQAVFGYLVLRVLGARPLLGVLGAAFFATSPALLQRFEHLSLCAHWEILAAWWLYLRRWPPGASWRRLLAWLALLSVTIPTYVYLGLMVGVLAGAAYARALWVDRSLTWRAAAAQAAVAMPVIYAVFWVFGYFALRSRGESGFGQFSSDLLAFVNSAGASSIMPAIESIPRTYEGYYFLGLGLIALIPISLWLAATRGGEATDGPASAPTRFGAAAALWPGALAALVMFAYAWASPVRLAGHPVLTVPLYAHIPQFAMWFRGSGRFAWPLYYLVMALVLATVGRRAPPVVGAVVLSIALALQLFDQRPLRTTVRRDYSWPWPRLEAPTWRGIGTSFRSLRLVPPILAHRIACRSYDQHEDYEIRFGVLAASERMAFNSGNPARVDDWSPLCVPMLDSLKRGLMDPHTVYIPSATYREAIEWWSGGHAVCGTVEDANVCVAPDGPAATAPLTQALIAQRLGAPSAAALHFDLRGGDAGVVDSTRGLAAPDTGGRRVTGDTAWIFYSRPLPQRVQVVIDAGVSDSATGTPLAVALGTESRSLVISGRHPVDTLAFDGGIVGSVIRITRPQGDSAGTARTTSAPNRPELRLRQLTVLLP